MLAEGESAALDCESALHQYPRPLIKRKPGITSETNIEASLVWVR